MASGIEVSSECEEEFEKMKKDKKYGYLILKIQDWKAIEVDSCGDKGATYTDFTKALVDAKIAYGLVFVQGRNKEGIAFVAWIPDEAKIKEKMIYASSSSALKTKFKKDITISVEFHSIEDLESSNIEERC